MPEIAQKLNVSSLPTIDIWFNAKFVDRIVGVPSDNSLETFVNKAIQLGGAEGAGKALNMAEQALKEGKISKATQMYSDLLQAKKVEAQATAGLGISSFLKIFSPSLFYSLIYLLQQDVPWPRTTFQWPKN